MVKRHFKVEDIIHKLRQAAAIQISSLNRSGVRLLE